MNAIHKHYPAFSLHLMKNNISLEIIFQGKKTSEQFSWIEHEIVMEVSFFIYIIISPAISSFSGFPRLRFQRKTLQNHQVYQTRNCGQLKVVQLKTPPQSGMLSPTSNNTAIYQHEEQFERNYPAPRE